jgi:hypothetical protein
MEMRKYFCILILIFGAMVSCRRVPKNYSKEDIPTAQTTPPDMVFVAGDGSLPSFYMGISEECNINYQIYRNWQNMVFLDYPEVNYYSEPQNRDVSDLLQFNDPYYSYYQNHEAFAYYPIVGVSWVQAMDYLQWKGDRLNEKILMDIGITDKKDIWQQTNEQNFNTEAYLCGQYEGLTKKDLPDNNLGGTTRKVRYDDGMLFCTPRLPTEAEWEYALANYPSKPINPKTYANPFSKVAMFPFGHDYYPFIFGRKHGLEFYEHLEQGFPYHVKYDSIPTVPDRLTGAADYNLAAPGIANLEGNVYEWLMDEYTENPEYNSLSFLEYFSKYCSRELPDEWITDGEGYLYEKDSLGRMNFKYFGIPYTAGPHNKPQPFAKHQIGYSKVVGFEREYYDSVKNKIVPNYYQPCTGNYNGFVEFRGYYVVVPYKSNNPWDHCKEMRNSLLLYKDSVGYYYNQALYEETIPYDNTNYHRVVKGGSWRQPDGHKREKMLETEGSPNVGFRAVITYTGIPLFDKKYKVKWR